MPAKPAILALIESVNDTINLIESYDPAALLKLDTDPHAPSALNVQADDLRYRLAKLHEALKEAEAAKPVMSNDVENLMNRVVSGQAEEEEILALLGRLIPPTQVTVPKSR